MCGTGLTVNTSQYSTELYDIVRYCNSPSWGLLPICSWSQLCGPLLIRNIDRWQHTSKDSPYGGLFQPTVTRQLITTNIFDYAYSTMMSASMIWYCSSPYMRSTTVRWLQGLLCHWCSHLMLGSGRLTGGQRPMWAALYQVRVFSLPE